MILASLNSCWMYLKPWLSDLMLRYSLILCNTLPLLDVSIKSERACSLLSLSTNVVVFYKCFWITYQGAFSHYSFSSFPRKFCSRIHFAIKLVCCTWLWWTFFFYELISLVHCQVEFENYNKLCDIRIITSTSTFNNNVSIVLSNSLVSNLRM